MTERTVRPTLAEPRQRRPADRPAGTRADSLLWLQHAAGNNAVAELIGRGRQVVQREAAPAVGSKVKHTTGKEVDRYLLSNSLLKPYVQSKMKGGTTGEKAVQIHDAAAFKDAWLAHALKSINPRRNRNYTLDEAEAWEGRVNAFLDGDTVHVHEGRGDPGTTVHETLHVYSSQAFIDAAGYNLNEGTTEYFTRLVTDKHRIERAASSFSPQRFAVEWLVRASSLQTLADAYFNNNLEPLKQAVEKKGGEGTWAKWQALLEDSLFADANKLLR